MRSVALREIVNLRVVGVIYGREGERNGGVKG